MRKLTSLLLAAVLLAGCMACLALTTVLNLRFQRKEREQQAAELEKQQEEQQ